jgi:hypothetical protein
MITREQIFGALFNLASTGEGRPGRITWPGGGQLAYTSRKVKLWADLTAQPALCQAEPKEAISQVTGLPSKRLLKASWMLFHSTATGSLIPPTITNNNALDAIEALLAPPDDGTGRQTLGGLVHHCWIEGDIFKDPGDLDDQALLIVPISILVP